MDLGKRLRHIQVKQKHLNLNFHLTFFSWDLSTHGTENTYFLSQAQSGPHQIIFEFSEQLDSNLNLILMSMIPRSVHVDSKYRVTYK